LSFGSFVVGYFIAFQGLSTAVGLELGPDTLVTFTALRAYSRIPAQLSGSLRNSFWPAISEAYGKNSFLDIRRLVLLCLFGTLTVSGVAMVFQIALYSKVFLLWSKIKSLPKMWYVMVLIGSALAQNVWLAISLPRIATNTHSRIGVWFLTANLVMLVVAVIGMKATGMGFACCAMLGVESIMVVVSIRAFSLKAQYAQT
jgi:O-antigen/teichoic acid export membrane protein